MDLADRRDEYENVGIDLADVSADAIEQFGRWYRDAEAADLWEPNAMVLATVDAQGWPTSRFVLMKGFDHQGFVFFTNYESEKAQALDTSGRASLTFGWLPLRRQVRVQGTVSRVNDEQSDDYFARRPRGAQVRAWASPQSHVVEDRQDLERRYAAIEAGIGEGSIARPPHWGGYRVAPERIEFWQGRPNRFHDRLLYERTGQPGNWTISRLAP